MPKKSSNLKRKQQIIEEGKELFVKFGNYGFSMRDLANKLEMSQGNIWH